MNTVNTVGVMGKGIALMFKEAFLENFKAYEAACKRGELQIGRMFVTERRDFLDGPKWIINFPTKQHWRSPSQIKWIESGLEDLARVIAALGVRSIAIPPLGSGNGGLEWQQVRPLIESALSSLTDVEVIVYEPAARYQNVAKREGVEKLTPPRALIAELVRRYSILGIECTLLEVQKLGYVLERNIVRLGLPNDLDLQFKAERYGPYSHRLMHLLNGLDGSYLHCDKRIADAGPFDSVRFEDSKKDHIATYLQTSEAKPFQPALEATTALIEGFELPLQMELLTTTDWLIDRQNVARSVAAIKNALTNWSGGGAAAERKLRLFEDRLINLALDRLQAAGT